MIMDVLYADVKKKSCVCLGLDTQPSFLPKSIMDLDMSMGERMFEFNRHIIDATYELVGCYKVQIACYEALGIDGLACFSRTLRYIRGKGCVCISDVKRGDIASTAKQYAAGHFTGDFETDIITVNAYMGEDAISPYYEYINNGKGLFVLVKTSNPSGGELQDLHVDDERGMTLYQHMAEKVSQWGGAFIGESGFSSIGAVTGLTYPEEFATIKSLMPNTFLLIPGYGAQGGTGRDIAEFFRDGIRGVVNSSRGLITAHRGRTEGYDFSVYVRQAVLNMKEDIEKWL